jgi:F-type H+-transporting ATPase subunit b
MGHSYAHFWLDPKFWVAVSFVLFVVLVGRTAWAKITEALDGRAAKVRAELDEARRLRAEAEAMLRAAEAERAAAEREAADTLARARHEAERVAEAAAAEAEAMAQRRERMAHERIAAAEAATAAARQVIAQSLDAEGGAALVDAAVADLPRALRAA